MLHQQRLKRYLPERRQTSFSIPPAQSCSITPRLLQSFPLLPQLSRTRQHAKLRAIFLAVSVSALDAFTDFAEWLVAAELLENVLGREYTGRCLPLLLLVPPVKLFIVGRTFTGPELAGAGLAYVCADSLSRFRWRRAVVGGLIVCPLIVCGPCSLSVEQGRQSILLDALPWVSQGGIRVRDADVSSEMLLGWIGSLAVARDRLAPGPRGRCRNAATLRS